MYIHIYIYIYIYVCIKAYNIWAPRISAMLFFMFANKLLLQATPTPATVSPDVRLACILCWTTRLSSCINYMYVMTKCVGLMGHFYKQ